MLISKQSDEALNTLYGAFFDLNATLDVCVSYMLNVWAMPQASDLVHQNLAHTAPKMADFVSEIKDNYNLRSIRPQVHEDTRSYNNLQDMFETVLQEYSDVYQMMKMVDKIAHENGDFMVHADIVKLMQLFSKVIGVVITLRDKASQMPNDYDEFDRHSTSWGIEKVAEWVDEY